MRSRQHFDVFHMWSDKRFAFQVSLPMSAPPVNASLDFACYGGWVEPIGTATSKEFVRTPCKKNLLEGLYDICAYYCRVGERVQGDQLCRWTYHHLGFSANETLDCAQNWSDLGLLMMEESKDGTWCIQWKSDVLRQ